jgi:alpha-ketoglutaric semialdehyde dehydrogenase
MNVETDGRHLIAGKWIATEQTFAADVTEGAARRFSVGTDAMVDLACVAAEAAYPAFAATSRDDRATFLDTIADEIEARGEEIVRTAHAETGLPVARLTGERHRTTGQLRLFAEHIRKGDHLDLRGDPALPERQPAPRPAITLLQRPIGPVAVFGASNFPLAFSTAGGDTAAALAAGCPVVVKGHSAHPGTGEIVAEAILAAIQSCDLPAGVFSHIQGGRSDVGVALVTHPFVKAVGFTGSLAGGRAMFDLCAQRPEPIPFFGELGSVNPMFLLPGAVAERAEAIGRGWAGSLTMGAGQFCTKPGIAVVIGGPEADLFVASTGTALAEVGPQTMLTPGIAAAYRDGKARFENHAMVTVMHGTDSPGREASPNLYETTGECFLKDHSLAEEVFGPLGLVVRVHSFAEMEQLARHFEGQLTATIHMAASDMDHAHRLMPILERKAGRILVNGFPTGVEVVDSQVHGGPYPASTNFGATSVGTLSIRRFLRPVAYQNVPDDLLPELIARTGRAAVDESDALSKV